MSLQVFDYDQHPLIRAFEQKFLTGAAPLVKTVDRRDEMLEFQQEVLQGQRDRALVEYFRSGQAIAKTYLELIDWHFGDHPPGRLLDFASGFGRVTRHLVRVMPAGHLTVCEISEGANAFQAKHFGVTALSGHSDPDVWRVDGLYDCILVTSLFTHLPETTFARWLMRLVEVLAPGGLLVFTVHDVSLLLPDRDIPSSGRYFEAASESRTLGGDDYGSLWVSEAWVEEQLSATAESLWARRIAYGLCDYQDLWVVVKSDEGPSTAPPVVADPRSSLEACEVRDGKIRLEGWSLARSQGARLESIEVEMSGEVIARAGDWRERLDVEASQEPQTPSYVIGWEIEGPLPEDVSPSRDTVLVVGKDSAAREHLIWLSTLEGALLHHLDFHLSHWRDEDRKVLDHMQLELDDAHRRVAAAEARIEAMRRSRFWYLREIWFSIKRRLGLTRDD